jgi:hypothetical protein
VKEGRGRRRTRMKFYRFNVKGNVHARSSSFSECAEDLLQDWRRRMKKLSEAKLKPE